MGTYVRLRVASEDYAIPVEHVLEVADLGEVTAVPESRAEIIGVRNLRGRILPVIDLASVLGIPQSGRPGRLLVVESGGHQAGLAIDEVSSVGDMEDPAEEAESDLLVGATLAGGHLIGVLDVPRLFDSLEGARQ